MRRLGMGLVGPGFVGAHHIDAVRRLGFVDVVAVAASSAKFAVSGVNLGLFCSTPGVALSRLPSGATKDPRKVIGRTVAERMYEHELLRPWFGGQFLAADAGRDLARRRERKGRR